VQKTSTRCVGPRRRLPYLCETATLLIFQRSRRVACRNEIISSALIFSPCGTPPGHRRQPPRRFPLKTRSCPRHPSRMSHSPGTRLYQHPSVASPRRQVGRQGTRSIPTLHIPVMNSYCTFFFAAFLPCKKQFSNYDKCQLLILWMHFCTFFITLANRLIIIFSHDISHATVLTESLG